jgi:SAM-dependent methyltransferase
MHARLLTLLRCPDCGGGLGLVRDGADGGDEVSSGLLRCAAGEHEFPILRGLPRMLPGSLAEEARSRESFGLEWERHEVGGRTWGMEVDQRVRVFFLDPLRIPAGELAGKVVLDAGCGDGSQSVAYSALGMEVIALDLSEGVEQGLAYRDRHPGARPEHLHFVQGDLRRPPLAPGSVDVIHCVGVLHHTPDTRESFRALRPLLRDGGTLYVWLYRREPYVTPLVDGIRAVTTRMPPRAFARVARVMAAPSLAVRATTTALRVRGYPHATRADAAFALIDTFGSPHRHCHSFDEVAGWYRAEGFTSVWRCNEGRRGFGACGRLPASA